MPSASLKPAAAAPIILSPPAEVRILSLHDAIAQRRTIREIDPTALSPGLLANLLWTAFGVNRQAGPFSAPGRTAASASNSQEIDVYVALEDGVYLYDGLAHRLDPVAPGDKRIDAMNRRQGMGSKAPVQLIYVVDIDRLTHTTGYEEPGLHDPEVQKSYYYVDTGLIAANVYLFAAAHGLASWFHNCDKDSLTKDLKLRPEQKVLFAHSVGWPAVPQAARL